MFDVEANGIFASMGKFKKDSHHNSKTLEWVAYAVALFALAIIYLMWRSFGYF